ncbi:MAG: DUF1573 domain-containing protein [Candidatus Zixiibacteriota bacterium]
MKMRFLRITIIGLVIGVTLISAGHSQDPWKVSEQMFDFGYVGIAYTIFHDFKIINTGRKPIQIDSVDVLCDCSSVLVDKRLLRPNDTAVFKLTFDTKDFYGPVNRKFHVFVSIPEKRVVTFFYLAEVGQWKNGLKPNPFSVFMLPTHKQQSVRITNRFFDSIKAEIENIHSGFFTVEFVRDNAGKDEVIEMSVIADEGLIKGTYLSNFTVKITTDDPENPAILTIPVKIARF